MQKTRFEGESYLNYITSYFTRNENGAVEWPHAILDEDLNVLFEWNGITEMYVVSFR